MPVDVGLRSGLLFLALVVAVPLQYYLSNETAVPASQRNAIFQKLIHSAHDIQASFLSVSSWKRWCFKLIKTVDGWRSVSSFISSSDEDDDDQGESPAIEVFHYKNPEGYFGSSTFIRSPRPPEVKYHVGQVVRHKGAGYRGVIVGWDPVAEAPSQWLAERHPVGYEHWRHMPNYAILVDTRDQPGGFVSYVPQENLEVITNTEIEHPQTQEYFDGFDGAIYLMRPAIKELYPHD